MENNNLSEFMKLAYKQGKVKNSKEAFKEYPVENEYHKGKIENVLQEKDIEYSHYKIGDIVFVKKYEYENGKEGNNHLFVIIDQNNFAIPIENFGMLVSSQLEKLKYKTNKLLAKDEQNGLEKDSIVKIDVIYVIKENQILFKIGEVNEENIEEYKRSFLENYKDTI